MNLERYHFEIGSIRCLAVNDGITGPVPIDELFINAPEADIQQACEVHGINPEQIYLARTCTFVDTGQHQVLIDTGVGFANDGQLVDNLKAEGVDPSAIDHVVFTHGHGDHINGTTDKEGNLVFPNAHFWMWKDEWAFWRSEQQSAAMETAANARKQLSTIEDRITLLEDEKEFIPGIQAIAAPGHTVGHMALSVKSGDEQLLCVGDLFFRPFQMDHIDWLVPFDRVTNLLPDTRRKLLSKAESEHALMLVYHFESPGLGQVTAKGVDQWQWQPVE